MSNSEKPDNVIHLVDHRAGFAPDNTEDLVRWLRAWVDQIAEDGNARSFGLVVETMDGQVYHLGQSLDRCALPRAVGLLNIAIHRMNDGAAKHPLVK